MEEGKSLGLLSAHWNTVRGAWLTLLTDGVNTHLDRPTDRVRSRVPRDKHTGSCPLCLHSHLHGTAEGSSHTHRCLSAIRTHKDRKHTDTSRCFQCHDLVSADIRSPPFRISIKPQQSLLKLSGRDVSCSRLWNICRSKFPFVKL